MVRARNEQLVVSEIETDGFERVLLAHSAQAQYQGVVAVHSSRLGPAVGGIRMWTYTQTSAALDDALRLARAMTCKNALAGLPFGGGKSVIVAAPAERHELLRAHAALINELDGQYIGAGDVGVSATDVEYLRTLSPYIARAASTQLDSGYFTAVGLLAAMRGAARMVWQNEDLRGRTIVVQGCGKVGASLAALLQPTGAEVAVADLDEARAAAVARASGASIIPAHEALAATCDIFSPCAVGPVFTHQNATCLAARVIVGGANCQLQDDDVAAVLARRQILYVPDFVANAGGVISGMATLADWPMARVEQHIAATRDRVCDLIERSERAAQTVLQAAYDVTEQRLNAR